MIKAGAVLVVLLALAFWGSEDAASDEIIVRFAAGILSVAAFPLVYAWRFAAIPAEFDDAKSRAIEGGNANLALVAASLERKLITKNHVLTLSVLLERGYEFNAQRISADQFDGWESGLEAWENLTLKYLASNFSHQDAVAFANVKYDPKENFIFKISADHNNCLQRTAARLEKLREIIGRHEEAWSPISPAERQGINTTLAVFQAQVLAADGVQALDEEDGGEPAA